MIYLIHGENYLENEAAVARLIVGAVPIIIDGKSGKWIDIRESIQSSSLFPDDRTIIIKHFLNAKQKADTLSEAIRVLGAINPADTIILYESQTVEAKNLIFVWVQKNGKVVYSPKPTVIQIKKWILSFCDEKKIEITPEAVTLLADEFIRHPEGLKNELEKISLYVAGKNRIETRDVTETTLFTRETNIFELGDLIGERKTGEALKALTTLFGDGVATGYITVMLARHLRLLIKLKQYIQEKLKPNEYAGTLKIPPFVAQRLRTQAGNFSASELQSAYGNLIITDWEVKKGKKPAELALELWVDKFCRNSFSSLSKS